MEQVLQSSFSCLGNNGYQYAAASNMLDRMSILVEGVVGGFNFVASPLNDFQSDNDEDKVLSSWSKYINSHATSFASIISSMNSPSCVYIATTRKKNIFSAASTVARYYPMQLDEDYFTFDLKQMNESINSGVVLLPEHINDIDSFEEWLEQF